MDSFFLHIDRLSSISNIKDDHDIIELLQDEKGRRQTSCSIFRSEDEYCIKKDKLASFIVISRVYANV